jgi:hypothetical protein
MSVPFLREEAASSFRSLDALMTGGEQRLLISKGPTRTNELAKTQSATGVLRFVCKTVYAIGGDAHDPVTQLGLFDQDIVVLGELYQALERLNLGSAEKLVRKYSNLPATRHKLSWEIDVLKFCKKIAKRSLDLDSGQRLWAEFSSRHFFQEIPEQISGRIKTSFFSRLLAANRNLFVETRTRGGRSIGELYLLAGQPKNARRLLGKEIRQYGENWQNRLHLGNANVLLKQIQGARASFRQAYLLGLPERRYKDILDKELGSFLRGVDEIIWAFPEAIVSGVLRTPPFVTRREFDLFYRNFAENCSADEFDPGATARRFAVLLILSQNRRFCGDSLLVATRKELKRLNPRLHARYMQSIE